MYSHSWELFWALPTPQIRLTVGSAWNCPFWLAIAMVIPSNLRTRVEMQKHKRAQWRFSFSFRRSHRPSQLRNYWAYLVWWVNFEQIIQSHRNICLLGVYSQLESLPNTTHIMGSDQFTLKSRVYICVCVCVFTIIWVAGFAMPTPLGLGQKRSTCGFPRVSNPHFLARSWGVGLPFFCFHFPTQIVPRLGSQANYICCLRRLG